MKIFDDTLNRVERSMDLRLIRHGVLAGNIANIDTPGYKPKDVDFAQTLAASEASGGVDPSEVRVIETAGNSPGMDGNGVDLDRTMASLAENSLQYQANARAATKKLAILRYAASDGNG